MAGSCSATVLLSQRFSSAVPIFRSTAAASRWDSSKMRATPAPVLAETVSSGASPRKRSRRRTSSSSGAIWASPRPATRSHLLTSRPTAQPRSSARFAMRASWSVAPSAASIATSATLARSTARTVISALPCSVAWVRRPARRSPAVSTSRKRWPSCSTLTSTASRVVPGTSDTTTRSSPTRRFTSELLPTLGRPTTAIRTPSPAAGAARLGLGQQRGDLLQRVPGASSVLRRDRARALEAEPVELGQPRRMLGPIDLVHHQGHRLVRAAERAGQFLVLGQQPGLAVHHEEDRVGAGDRGARLQLDLRSRSPRRVGIRPRRVPHQQAPAVCLDLLRDPVAGDARLVEREGPAAAGEAIEQGRLPDVRASNDRDDRKLRGTAHGVTA